MMNNYENDKLLQDEEKFPVLEAMCQLMRMTPDRTKLLEVERWKEMLTAKEILEEILREMGEETAVRIQMELSFSAAALTVELEDFYVLKPEKFVEIIRLADNFEIYPLLNGGMRMGFMFYRMMKTVK